MAKGSKKRIKKDVYQLRWDAAGTSGDRKQKSERFYGRSKDADARLRTILAEVEAQKRNTETKTVNDLANKFVSEYVQLYTKPRTAESYEEILRVHILPDLGTVPLLEVNREMCQQLLLRKAKEATIHGRPRSASSLKRYQTVMHIMFEAGIEWGWLQDNPARIRFWKPKLKNQTIASKPEIPIFTHEQINQFLEVAKEDYFYVAFIIGLTLGLRRGEILALTWPDIDFETGIVDINKSVQRFKVKGINVCDTKSFHSNRKEVLPPSVLKALVRHKDHQEEIKKVMGSEYNDQSLVFCRHDGFYWDPKTMYSHFKKLAKKIGLPTTRLHDLRHNYVTNRIDQGDPISEVSQDMGHGSIAVTYQYDHATYVRKKNVALKMEQLLFNNTAINTIREITVNNSNYMENN